jgi:DNA replication protein DnaC
MERIRAMIESGQLKTESEVKVCQFCYGSGVEVLEDRSTRLCRCRRAAFVASRLNAIPPRYRGVTLDTLAARPDLHPKQQLAIELMRKCPTDSYVFCGKPGTGKTHFMYALYQHMAHSVGRKVVVCSMLQLINEYREAFRPMPDGSAPQAKARIYPNQLMEADQPYSLFFDDIDKPKISEYVAEQVHALVDAAYLNQHQTIVTTNLSPERLTEHFARADDRFGEAIVRRIVNSESNVIEFG